MCLQSVLQKKHCPPATLAAGACQHCHMLPAAAPQKHIPIARDSCSINKSSGARAPTAAAREQAQRAQSAASQGRPTNAMQARRACLVVVRAAQRSLVHTACVLNSRWTHARAHPRASATARAPPSTRRRTTRLQPDAVHIPLVALDTPSRRRQRDIRAGKPEPGRGSLAKARRPKYKT